MTESAKKVKAQVTTVKIGHLEIEGLMLPNSSFAIAVPQIAKLFPYFQDSQNRASQKLKRLMGNDFKTTKVTTEYNRNATLAVDLESFVEVLKKLTEINDNVATKMLFSLVGLSLHQLFCDAFGRKFDAEDRQAWLKARAEGKVVRRSLTDAIKDYCDRQDSTPIYRQFVYSNVSDCINVGLFGTKAKAIKEHLKTDSTRDGLTDKRLRHIEYVESLAMRLIDADNIEPLKATKEALARLQIPVEALE